MWVEVVEGKPREVPSWDKNLATTEGKEEELDELSIWLRMPTTYFHPVGLLVDDLDCDAALLPSIFFFFFYLPPSRWLANRDYSQRAEPGSQTERLSMWPTEWHTEGRETKTHFSSLFFAASHFPLLYPSCFCVIYTLPFVLHSSLFRDILSSPIPGWKRPQPGTVTALFWMFTSPRFYCDKQKSCRENDTRRLSWQDFLWLHNQRKLELVCLLLRINSSCWFVFTAWVNWFKH